MTRSLRFLLPASLLFAACGNGTADHPVTDTVAAITPAAPETTMPQAPTGTHCFLKALNRDTTRIRLEFDGDSVRGTMDWLPWEKDRAVGTLRGVRTGTGELDLVYDYVIEGNRQTETKIMKLEGTTLRIKVGELEDPSNNGTLRYKDASKAAYTESLDEVPCP